MATHNKILIGISSLTLVASGMTIGLSPASAASTEYVLGSQIEAPGDPVPSGWETSVYNQWHFGPASGRNYEVVQATDGITFKEGTITQVLKGNTNDLDMNNDSTSVRALVNSLKAESTDNNDVFWQIPIRIEVDGVVGFDPATIAKPNRDRWTTLFGNAGDPSRKWALSRGNLWPTTGPVHKDTNLEELLEVLEGEEDIKNLVTQADNFDGDSYPIAVGFNVQNSTNTPVALTKDVTVRAVTIAGTTTRFHAKPVVTKPGKPRNVKATPIHKGVKLTWSPPADGAAPTNYRIKVGSTVTISSGQARSVTVKGLRPGSQTTWSIQAQTAAGTSAAITGRVRILAKPAKVRSIIVTPASRGRAQIRVTAPKVGHRSLRTLVTVYIDGKRVKRYTGSRAAATRFGFNVKGQKRGKRHTVTVVTANELGTASLWKRYRQPRR